MVAFSTSVDLTRICSVLTHDCCVVCEVGRRKRSRTAEREEREREKTKRRDEREKTRVREKYVLTHSTKRERSNTRHTYDPSHN